MDYMQLGEMTLAGGFGMLVDQIYKRVRDHILKFTSVDRNNGSGLRSNI